MLALLAGVLAEATLALGRRGSLSNDNLLRPAATASPTPTASSTPSPTLVPVVAPTAAATPVPTPATPTATTNSFVHMRSGKSTATPILTDLNGGTVVELLPDSDSQWQQVRYGGLTGYVFKTYLAY
ncbi:MAG TPA: SH3 domain-containing protein [Candidatus Saccharimonadia bacterium]|nr:SH3 domain-containing protein [Candidatus Saccharimonadia bacterium]